MPRNMTIPEPVRRRALELAETYWERHMKSEAARERKEWPEISGKAAKTQRQWTITIHCVDSLRSELMPQTVSAEFDGKVIIPDQPLGYPRGQRLRITVEPLNRLDQSKLVAQLPPELEWREDGAIVVRGHRATLHLILDAIDRGAGLEEIHERFPDIGKEVLGRVLEFCRQHTELVRPYAEEQKSLAEQYCDAAHQGPSRDELRARRNASRRS